MSITMLRWKAGAGGDTVLKLLLESDPGLHSQNKYLLQKNGKTTLDADYADSFRYNLIGKMSRGLSHEVDQDQLFYQLDQLNHEDPSKNWLLKTHCYFDFSYPVIDIVISQTLLPFVIRANLAKNSRQKNLMPDYHPMVSKIKDPGILYKFDCYNTAVDLLQVKYSAQQLQLQDLLAGWDCFVRAIDMLSLQIDVKCRDYYNTWLQNNQQFIPSSAFVSLVASNNYNYNCKDISIEERYCLLALSKERFQLLD